MYANEPLIIAVLIADRRAALQRAATPSRTTPTSDCPGRLRRLIDAVMQRKRPSPQSSALDHKVQVEATQTARPEPVFVQLSIEQDEETRDLVCAAR